MTRNGRASGAFGWVALAALLALSAALGHGVDPALLDWQPALSGSQPWRGLTAVAVHYSTLHLGANLAGATAVAILGVAAGLPLRCSAAWALAWPLTQAGLLLRPDLLHYGGLSGVLHAGVAIAALHLAWVGDAARRTIGVGLAIGLVLKVLGETPWGPALSRPAGWDIAVAPFAHLTGVLAGFGSGLLAEVVAAGAAMRRRRTPRH